MYKLTVVAEMLEIHPDTIRRYERQGLVQSERGLYSEAAVLRIRRVVTATRLGVNLAGAEMVANLLERIEHHQAEAEALREQVRRLLGSD